MIAPAGPLTTGPSLPHRDSSLECIGLLVQTFFHAYVLMSPAFGERTKQLLIVLGNTVVIPIALFFGVLGRPMWKCCSRETELACPFDPCFESRTSRFAGIHPLIGYSSPPRLQSPLRADYRRDTSSPSFEVEELSKLVMAGTRTPAVCAHAGVRVPSARVTRGYDGFSKANGHAAPNQRVSYVAFAIIVCGYTNREADPHPQCRAALRCGGGGGGGGGGPGMGTAVAGCRCEQIYGGPAERLHCAVACVPDVRSLLICRCDCSVPPPPPPPPGKAL